MAYILLSVLGIIALLAARKEWKAKTQITFIFLVLITGIIVYTLVDIFILEQDDGLTKGIENVLSKIEWLDISLYFSILIGMACKYFFDHWGEKRKKKFNKKKFFRPMLVSPVIFGYMYYAIPENTSIVMILIIAYQNGFFWQTVFDSLAPKK